MLHEESDAVIAKSASATEGGSSISLVHFRPGKEGGSELRVDSMVQVELLCSLP